MAGGSLEREFQDAECQRHSAVSGKGDLRGSNEPGSLTSVPWCRSPAVTGSGAAVRGVATVSLAGGGLRLSFAHGEIPTFCASFLWLPGE